MAAPADYHAYPDAQGHFGRHGGCFVAETLIGPLQELSAAYDAARVDPAFVAEFEYDLNITSAGPARSITPSVGPKPSVGPRFT